MNIELLRVLLEAAKEPEKNLSNTWLYILITFFLTVAAVVVPFLSSYLDRKNSIKLLKIEQILKKYSEMEFEIEENYVKVDNLGFKILARKLKKSSDINLIMELGDILFDLKKLLIKLFYNDKIKEVSIELDRIVKKLIKELVKLKPDQENFNNVSSNLTKIKVQLLSIQNQISIMKIDIVNDYESYIKKLD